jgi:hypothetical protein
MHDGLTLWQEHENLYEDTEQTIDAYHDIGHKRAEADREYHEIRAQVYDEIRQATNATTAREMVSGIPKVAEAKEKVDKLEVTERWLLEKVMLQKKRYEHIGDELAREWSRPSNE